MPKRARELSAQEVSKLTGDGLYAVGGMIPGLHLKIDGGSRSWILRITVCGKRRDLGVGSYPIVSLSSARKGALALHANPPTPESVAGPDVPAQAALDAPTLQVVVQPARTEQTFKVCAKTYIDTQAPGWKSAKHGKQWYSTLEKYAYPVIGHLNVSQISTAHLVEILKPIWISKTETATRVRGRIEAILDWAGHKGFRDGRNSARWEENLIHELPSPTKLKKRKQRHHPALPYSRMGAFMVDLKRRRGMSARALEFGIHTATRYQELAGAKHGEIDLQLKRWTIPPERMKREIEHVIPLSDEAIELYLSLPAGGPEDLLFPAPESGGELSDSALGNMIDDIHAADLARGGIGYMDPKEGRIATQHGMRSTFRDWAAEMGFFERDIIEHAIAHKLKDKAEAAYQRGTLLLKRAFLMKEWSKFCATPEFSPEAKVLAQARAA